MFNRIKKSNFFLKILESFLGKGAYSIFTILFSLVCARLYGAEALGEFTYAFTIITILAIFSIMGLDNGLIFSLANHKNRQVSFSFLFNFILSLMIICIFGFLLDNQYLKYMLPLVWLFSVENLFFSLYRHEGKFKEYYFINGFLSMILRLILVIALYYILGDNPENLLFAVLISFTFSNIIYFVHHRKKFRKIYFDKGIIYFSFPLLLTSVTAVLIGKIDIILLGNLASNQEVGVFQVILQITGLISVILTIFVSVLAPRFAEMYKNSDFESLKKLYINSTRILFGLALVFSLSILGFSEFILGFFGEDFKSGKLALIFMCIGQFFNVAVGAVWTLMAMSGKPKFQMYANIGALVVNLILNLILIPKYGIVGAGFSSMLTICLTNIIGYLVVKKEYKINVFKFI